MSQVKLSFHDEKRKREKRRRAAEAKAEIYEKSQNHQNHRTELKLVYSLILTR